MYKFRVFKGLKVRLWTQIQLTLGERRSTWSKPTGRVRTCKLKIEHKSPKALFLLYDHLLLTVQANATLQGNTRDCNQRWTTWTGGQAWWLLAWIQRWGFVGTEVAGRAPPPEPEDQSGQVRAVSWLVLRFKRQQRRCQGETLRTGGYWAADVQQKVLLYLCLSFMNLCLSNTFCWKATVLSLAVWETPVGSSIATTSL